jgi:hypothetical protein
MHNSLNHRIRILRGIIKKQKGILNPVLYWIDVEKHDYNIVLNTFLALFVARARLVRWHIKINFSSSLKIQDRSLSFLQFLLLYIPWHFTLHFPLCCVLCLLVVVRFVARTYTTFWSPNFISYFLWKAISILEIATPLPKFWRFHINVFMFRMYNLGWGR